MRNLNRSSSEGTVRMVGDRFVGVIKGVGGEAWEDLKAGIDKAWDKIKLGVDEGIQSASDGFSKGWQEMAYAIERAKDSLLRSQNDNGKYDEDSPIRTNKRNRNKVRVKEELT